MPLCWRGSLWKRCPLFDISGGARAVVLRRQRPEPEEHFGRSSEQLDAKIAQLELTLEKLEANQSLITPPAAPITEERPERTRPVRKALPSHFKAIRHARPKFACRKCCRCTRGDA